MLSTSRQCPMVVDPMSVLLMTSKTQIGLIKTSTPMGVAAGQAVSSMMSIMRSGLAPFMEGRDLQYQGPGPLRPAMGSGIRGKLYGSGWSLMPSGTIYISREYVMTQEAQVQVSNSIQQAEQSLKGKLPDSPRIEVLSSWFQLIQHTLLFLTETCTLSNTSHCFLCVSLSKDLCWLPSLLCLLQKPRDKVNVSLHCLAFPHCPLGYATRPVIW